MLIKIAWRLFRHELQRGDLWVIAFAMLLTVFSVVSLSGITESVRQALSQRSSQLNAADIVVRTNRAIPDDWWALAKQHSLQTSAQQQFNTMAFAGDAMQLVAVKAVDQSYPLRGLLQLQGFDGTAFSHVSAGQVFIDKVLQDRLGVKQGDRLDIGARQFVVSGLIINEPDAPLNLFGGFPRVLMSTLDVASTQVIQPGSQVNYKALFAGESSSQAAFINALKPTLQSSDRIQDIDRQSTLGATLDRAERFIMLAGLLGVILSCCAAAVAAKRYAERQRLSIAILKAIGLTQNQSKQLYFSHLAIVVCSSAAVGLALGFLAIQTSGYLMAQWLEDYQPSITVTPFMMGLLTALLCASLFAARPLWLMTQTPALDVLRQGAQRLRLDPLHLVISASAVYLLMWFFSGDWQLSLVLFGACAAAAGVIFAAAALVIKYVKPVNAGQTSSFALALASLRRRLWANAFQLVTFTLAIFLALLLFFLRTELISQWRAQLPVDAPNVFLVNIDGPEQAAISEFFEQQQVAVGRFYPMVAARVTAINGESLIEPDEQAKAAAPNAAGRRTGFGRELNLTWSSELPQGNIIERGQWFGPESKAEVSVESRQAERLALNLGDTISFSVGGIPKVATVTSIRKVDWNTLQPNFFMVLSPDLMQDIPATRMTTVKVTPQTQSVLNDFAKQWPTVSQISVEQLIRQVQQVISQVSLALSFILVLIVASAVLVLTAQIQSTVDERQRELALLRTLGATSRFLRKSVLFEFALLGALAGVIATVLAEAVLFVLQQQLSGTEFALHMDLWLIGPFSGMVAVCACGAVLLKKVMVPTPSQVIRQALAEQ